MKAYRYFPVLKNFKPIVFFALLAPLTVACAPTENATCSRLVFQPHGSSSFNNAGPTCPQSKVYSYDPTLFERQATWVESYDVSEGADKKKNKKKSSI